MTTPKADPFTCPRCKTVSHHPTDIEQRYCARCHEWADDMPVARGLYTLFCFNALGPDQQEFLVVEGYLPMGYIPRGGTCLNGAEVGLEFASDYPGERAPGPRFYCVPCAIEYLRARHAATMSSPVSQ
jgi:hypothetical protein